MKTEDVGIFCVSGGLSAYAIYEATNDPILTLIGGLISGATSTVGASICNKILSQCEHLGPILLSAAGVVASCYFGYILPKNMIINDFNEKQKKETTSAIEYKVDMDQFAPIANAAELLNVKKTPKLAMA